MVDNNLTPNDLRQAGLEKSLRQRIKNFDVVTEEQKFNSVVRILKVYPGGKEVFSKQHVSTPRSESEEGKKRNDPYHLHSRERDISNIIYNNISRKIVPRPLGFLTSPQKYLLFWEHVPPSAREEFLRLHHELKEETDEKRKEQLEKQKSRQILKGFKQIAYFDGLINHCSQRLDPIIFRDVDPKQGIYHFVPTTEEEARKFADYLRKAVHSRELRDEPYDEDMVNEFIRQKKGIPSLELAIEDILAYERSLGFEYKISHRDCWLPHNLNGRFCDLEDLGYDALQTDIVSYANEEISTPSIDEIPRLATLFYLYEAFYEKDPKQGKRTPIDALSDDIEGLKGMIADQAIEEKIANFVLGYYAKVIKKDIQTASVRSKYDDQKLFAAVGDYGLTPEELRTSKIDHLQRIYDQLITGGRINQLLERVSDSDQLHAVKRYFHGWGTLFNRLGFTELELGNLNGATSWDIFK